MTRVSHNAIGIIDIDGLLVGEAMVREMRDLIARQDKTIVELSAHQARANDVNRECIGQRDAALTLAESQKREVERLGKELAEARRAGAWKPSEVWREEVADEVAEAIATWLEALMVANPDDWSITPEDIRDGAWRKP